MSTRAAHTSEHRSPRRTRRGSRAFIVEALVLFVFLVITLAIVSQLFFASANQAPEEPRARARDYRRRQRRRAFLGQPHERRDLRSRPGWPVGALRDHAAVHGKRTLYEATITVSNEYEDIYTLTTARYVSEVR